MIAWWPTALLLCATAVRAQVFESALCFEADALRDLLRQSGPDASGAPLSALPPSGVPDTISIWLNEPVRNAP